MRTKLFAITIMLAATLVSAELASGGHPAHGEEGLSTLKGAFGCRASGFILPPNFNPPGFPEVEVERLVFDGAGHFSGSQTLQFLGIVCDFGITSGTYSINSDGGGSMTYTELPAPGADPNCINFASSPRVGNLVIGPSGQSFFTVDSLSFSGGCTSQASEN